MDILPALLVEALFVPHTVVEEEDRMLALAVTSHVTF